MCEKTRTVHEKLAACIQEVVEADQRLDLAETAEHIALRSYIYLQTPDQEFRKRKMCGLGCQKTGILLKLHENTILKRKFCALSLSELRRLFHKKNFLGQEVSLIPSTRDSVLAEANSFHKTARPNIRVHWVKILYDNAPAHESELVQENLIQENVETLQHPAYSPDLAPQNFILAPHNFFLWLHPSFYKSLSIQS